MNESFTERILTHDPPRSNPPSRAVTFCPRRQPKRMAFGASTSAPHKERTRSRKGSERRLLRGVGPRSSGATNAAPRVDPVCLLRNGGGPRRKFLVKGCTGSPAWYASLRRRRCGTDQRAPPSTPPFVGSFCTRTCHCAREDSEETVTTISTKASVVTLANTFKVEPEDQQRLVDVLVESAEVMQDIPGFVSASIHKSLDGTRVLTYGQWESREAWEAMLRNPAAQPHMRKAEEIGTIDPYLYEVVFVRSNGEGDR